MIILGIDPGSRFTGFGVIKLCGKKIEYLDSGILNFSKTEEFLPRLREINNEAKILVEKYSPDEVSVESLIYVKNVSSLAKLAQARGAMLGSILNVYSGKIFEYAPNLVKNTVSGHGHSSKDGMVSMLQIYFGKIDYKTHDESDGLAIALCHALLRDKLKSLGQNSNNRRNSNSLGDALRNNKNVLQKLKEI